jgi:hypothetical protein
MNLEGGDALQLLERRHVRALQKTFDRQGLAVTLRTLFAGRGGPKVVQIAI